MVRLISQRVHIGAKKGTAYLILRSTLIRNRKVCSRGGYQSEFMKKFYFQAGPELEGIGDTN